MRLLLATAILARNPARVRMASSSIWDRVATDRSTQTITVAHDAAASEQPTASVVVLHGLGDTAQGWVDVAAIWAGAMPSVRFVLPTAPRRAVTLNGGMHMPAWYDIKSLDGSKVDRDTCDGIAGSKADVDALVTREAALVGGAHRVVLAGFSQGGALALYAGLQRGAQPLAGVVSMSGYLPAKGHWQVPDASRGVPVGFFHGDADEVVRPEWADMSAEHLRAQGLGGVSVRTYAGMAHSAAQEEISDVAAFITRALGATAAGGARL